MDFKNKLIQSKTFFLQFNSSPSAIFDVNIPFAVDRIIFRSLAYDSTITEYAVLSSDLINWESIGIVYRDSSFSNSTAQTIEYHFQTPTFISGRYNFTLRNLDKTIATVGGPEFCVFIAEFIKDGVNSDSNHM